MGNNMTETTPWSDCPLDIFSLGETNWAFKICLFPSFRRPFTEVGTVTLRCLPRCVNHPGFSFEPQASSSDGFAASSTRGHLC